MYICRHGWYFYYVDINLAISDWHFLHFKIEAWIFQTNIDHLSKNSPLSQNSPNYYLSKNSPFNKSTKTCHHNLLKKGKFITSVWNLNSGNTACAAYFTREGRFCRKYAIQCTHNPFPFEKIPIVVLEMKKSSLYVLTNGKLPLCFGELKHY
jgi:hypothetical protein